MLTLILTKKKRFTKHINGKKPDKLTLKIELIIFTTTKLI